MLLTYVSEMCELLSSGTAQCATLLCRVFAVVAVDAINMHTLAVAKSQFDAALL